MDFGPSAGVHPKFMGRHMLHTLYYNRGNAHAAVGHHAEAVSDYDTALKHGSELRRNVLFNRGNSKYALGNFAEALDDFESAWSEREGSDAALASGNCQIMAGEFKEGLVRYLDGVRAGGPESSATHCRENARQLEALLEALGESDYDLRRDGQVVYVKAAGEAGAFPFAGSGGNAGNTPSGMVAAAGGKGYKGNLGFVVVVEPRQD